jgi:hypothetical protein
MMSANVGDSTDAMGATWLAEDDARRSLAVGAGDRDEHAATRTPSPSDKHDRRMTHQS